MQGHDPGVNDQAARRGFLSKVLALAAGGLATLAPAGAGVWVLLDPLRHRVPRRRSCG